MYYQRFAKGFLSAGFWSATQTLASALSLPIYARLLGALGFGQFAYYQALLLLAAPVGNLGVYQLLAKTIAERPEDETHRAAVVWVGARLNLVGAGLALGLAALVLLPSVRDPSAAVASVSIMVCLLADQAVLFSRGVLYGLHREARANLLVAAGSALSSAAGVAAAVAGWGVAGILLALAVANSLMALACLASAAPFFGLASMMQGAATSRVHLHPMVRFSLGSGALSLLAIAMFRIDLPLVQILAGSRQAGLYAAAAKGAEVVWFVPIALQSLMLQSTVGFWVEGQTERIGLLLSRLARYTALATAPLLIILAVFAEPILQTYFGADFAAAGWALRLIAPGVFCFGLARLVMPAIQARGALKALVATTLAAALADVALNLWLTPALGANGAALASTAAYSLAALLSVLVMQRFGVRPLAHLKVERLLLLCALTTLAAVLARLFLAQPLVATAAGSAIALVVFGAGALRLGLLETGEVYLISRHLPGPLGQRLAGLIHFVEPLMLRLEPGWRAP
jgi:O-antigen/teichoic acid export membrane protein